MFTSWLLFAFLALCLQQALGAPVVSPNGSATRRGISKRSIAGPKIQGKNFPDPTIIYVDKWYAFATRTIGSGIRIQIATSDDFETWDLVYNADGTQRDALPNLPDWVLQTSPNTWAPDVNILDDGTFVLYYSASVASDTSKHCVGAATSDNILGPYSPQAEPLFCPLDQGGAIDPAGFYDNGQRYVVYKVDGNSLGHGGACQNTVEPLVATPLILQPVSADGLTAQGAATTLLNHQGLSDDGILEAPALVKSGSTYVLFFSSGCFTTEHYNVDYATSSSITGPYTRTSTPLIESGTGDLSAPGGADVTRDGLKLVLHANNNGGRSLYTATIQISGTTVALT
ncbi:glycoside hydrolase family 43 protein [Dothistroma septosporum NZE10]|uniref:Glycoside hydrolase family 43 protein n=1 Tax=Dothistroma septosporum (strain NZE10 / CBS 128990) TaxID=675120 RepID=M2XLC4_DOTSN|nr:glycoside hydrolase family 43 protein [Dothistroma septosporum NZE10]